MVAGAAHLGASGLGGVRPHGHLLRQICGRLVLAMHPRPRPIGTTGAWLESKPDVAPGGRPGRRKRTSTGGRAPLPLEGVIRAWAGALAQSAVQGSGKHVLPGRFRSQIHPPPPGWSLDACRHMPHVRQPVSTHLNLGLGGHGPRSRLSSGWSWRVSLGGVLPALASDALWAACYDEQAARHEK